MRVDYYFKDFKMKALTMSYDDGAKFDRRLVEIFNKNGIRGTFHLNSSRYEANEVGDITPEEIPSLYKNHEVSCHTVHHFHPDRIPTAAFVNEIYHDKETLEGACGYVVRGMSYPFGAWTGDGIKVLRALGMNYSRTTVTTKSFNLPDDFMVWNPTCHHDNPELFELLQKFRDYPFNQTALMYVWGHSHDLERNGNWDRMEKFCEEASGMEDTWYATNIEIYDYVTAMRSLEISADGTIIYNPTATAVYAKADGREVVFEPGKMTKLA